MYCAARTLPPNATHFFTEQARVDEGLSAWRRGDLEGAIRWLRDALRYDPNALTLRTELVALYVKKDDFAGAVRAAEDVLALSTLTRSRGVEFNIEGNPFAPPREGYPGLLPLCEQTRPAQATLVPDDDGQITSDHGFDFERDAERLRPLRLRPVAMDPFDGHARLHEVAGQTIGAVLRPREHQGVLNLPSKQSDEQ